MNKTIIVYHSVTGFTKRYAEALSTSLDCDVVSLEATSAAQLVHYEIIIFGSRIHAGRIDKLAQMKSLVANSGSGKLILFVTGGTPAEAEPVINRMWKDNLSPEELEAIPHFYMPGGLCYEKMPRMDRGLMRLAAWLMSKKKSVDSVEAGFAQAIKASYDIWDEKYTAPLAAYVKELR